MIDEISWNYVVVNGFFFAVPFFVIRKLNMVVVQCTRLLSEDQEVFNRIRTLKSCVWQLFIH